MARRRSTDAARPLSRNRIAQRKPVSILDAEWDGLSVDALRERVLTDHAMRMTKRTAVNRWDERLVCRYVFRGMMEGRTETALVQAIGVEYSVFWNMIDRQFLRDAFKRARQFQAQALADSVDAIASGSDAMSRRLIRRMHRDQRTELKRALRKAKHPSMRRALKSTLRSIEQKYDEIERNLIARNKLMIAAKQWLAKVSDPERYSDKSTVALSNPTVDGQPAPMAISIRFVSPDGSTAHPGGG